MLLRLKNMMPLSPKIKALRVNDNVLYFSKYHSHIRVGYSNFFRIICLKCRFVNDVLQIGERK